MSKKIYIDPGHGGKDPGAINGKRHEADDNLRLALAVKRAVEKQGVAVVIARTTDKYVDLNARCKQANAEKCDYYISLHRNSGTSSAHGMETWVHSEATERTQKYGKMLNDAVIAATGYYNRGVKKGTPSGKSYKDFGVNRLTNMPSALLEVGFVTNKNDNALFDKNLSKIAESLAKALCEIVGVKYKDSGAEKPTPKPEPPKPSAEIKPDDIVIVNGAGTAGSSGAGKKSKTYKNQKMRVVKIIDGAACPYACSLILKKGDKAVTAWFNASQIKVV